jgi:chromosomal replication initiation ATPase DnaA
MERLAVEFSDPTVQFLPPANAHHPQQPDEVIETLVGALESAISSLRKAALARRAITRVHRIQAGVALSDITQHVADAFHVRSELLLSRKRTQHIAYCRAVAQFLCRKLTKNSFPDIGEFFDRDHSSVIHSYQLIERRIAQDAAFKRFIEGLQAQLTDTKVPAASSAPPEPKGEPQTFTAPPAAAVAA